MYINQKSGIMLTKKQLRIFKEFIKQPFNELTLKELKKLSKEKSNNALNLAMKKFKQEKLLNQKKVGKSSLYTLNLENDLVYYYMGLLNHEMIPKLAYRTINILTKELEKYTPFYALVVFGSYATQKYDDSSDLDIAVFVEKENMKKNIQIALNSTEQKSVVPFDGHTISRKEFLEMLKADYENLGKEIARRHLALINPQLFYLLINEGIKNGFRV